MNLVLAGATGFVGSEVLKQALADEAVTRVLVLTRRTTGLAHPRLEERVVTDFLDFSTIDFRGFDACIWSLGVSQVGITEAEYMKVTVGYPLAAANAMFAANPRLRFALVTGRSSDPTEKRTSLQARFKGRCERVVSELSPRNVFVFRPGYIRPSAKSVPRKDAGRFFAPLGALLDLFTDTLSIDCDLLARSLLHVAKHGGDQRLLINADLKRFTS